MPSFNTWQEIPAAGLYTDWKRPIQTVLIDSLSDPLDSDKTWYKFCIVSCRASMIRCTVQIETGNFQTVSDWVYWTTPAFGPMSGVSCLSTTRNSAENFLFFGLWRINRQEPSGFSFVSFHICSIFVVGSSFLSATKLMGMTFSEVPLCT